MEQYIEKLFKRLAEPMTYQWRLKSVTNKAKKPYPSGTKGQFLAYIDARDAFNRFDEVLGWENWDSDWQIVDPTRHAVKSTITVRLGDITITKSDVGYPNGTEDEEPLKSAVSDAFKRTAVQYGVGRFLYDLDAVWVEVNPYGDPLKPLPNAKAPAAKPVAPAPAATRPAAPQASQDASEPGQVMCEKCDEMLPLSAAEKSRERYDGHTLCFKHQLEYKRQQLQAKRQPDTSTSAATPACPVCGGEMWDNREGKKNPNAPDFKCKDRACDGVIWPEKQLHPKEDVQGMSVTEEVKQMMARGEVEVYGDPDDVASLYAQEGR